MSNTDQNTFHSKKWGALTFVPSDREDACRRCLLAGGYDNHECAACWARPTP